ncbi:hypothetical protein MMC34_004631 [Xylographa carneopallida]|nr:hypothetical protein [Xylographa carneopallida]
MKPPPHPSRLLQHLHHPLPLPTTTRSLRFSIPRPFSSTPRPLARNRIYEPICALPSLTTLLSLSSASSRPLLTYFHLSTTSTTDGAIRALLLQLLEREGVGEREGGVGYAEVELDAADCVAEDVGGVYAITSIPTLLAFSRGEPQQLTKLTDAAELQDREFLTLWIENEARRGDAGGAGGGFFGGIFGLGRGA